MYTYNELYKRRNCDVAYYELLKNLFYIFKKKGLKFDTY